MAASLIFFSSPNAPPCWPEQTSCQDFPLIQMPAVMRVIEWVLPYSPFFRSNRPNIQAGRIKQIFYRFFHRESRHFRGGALPPVLNSRPGVSAPAEIKE
jgi:hypothetical protein